MKKVGTIHFILLAGLIHGLLYIFLLPPWQHYDEPGHFEYAWLLANRSGLPSPGEYDQDMRREVAASMIEHGFFDELSLRPDLLAQDKPIWIGISQTDNPPIYYWIAALPLRLVQTSDITFQLYLCRMVSLLLYLITIFAAYGVLSELTTPENPARWLIPLTMVLLPGFTDLMTAVNSDVGAVAMFSVFLWASLRIMQRGFTVIRLLAVGLLAAGCCWTKNTAAIALPLLVFPVLFSIFHGRRQKYAWMLIGAGSLISLCFIFTLGDVAYWYPLASQTTPTRITSSQAALGSHVFQIDTSSGTSSNNLIQLLSPNQVQKLRGKTITLGYWIWANQPIQFHSPIIRDDQQTYSESINISPTPAFHTLTTKIARNTRHIQIVLEASDKSGIILYLDGLVLVKGDFSHSRMPVISSTGGQSGTWEGKSFVNLIRNGSAEQDWPRPRAIVQRLLQKISPLEPNIALASLADWQNSGWYYRITAKQLLRTFWGQFSWGQIPLSRNIYIGLSGLTALGVLGSLIAFWRNRKGMPWSIFAFLATAILGIWGAALVRGIHSIAGFVFIPSARYAYPAIIPTIGILFVGWAEWPCLFERWLHIPRWIKISTYLLSFLLLCMLSIWTIASFYGKL